MPSHKIQTRQRGLRLAEYDYSQAGWYFVTTCTRMWQSYFGVVKNGEMLPNELGRAVSEKWTSLPSLFANVDVEEFVVMPNHFHGIVIIQETSDGGSRAAATKTKESSKPNLSRIMNAFKTTSSRQVNILRCTLGVRVWQDGFYDHVIRNDRDLLRIREYIRFNPLKWELDRENPQSTEFKDRALNRPRVMPP